MTHVTANEAASVKRAVAHCDGSTPYDSGQCRNWRDYSTSRQGGEWQMASESAIGPVDLPFYAILSDSARGTCSTMPVIFQISMARSSWAMPGPRSPLTVVSKCRPYQ